MRRAEIPDAFNGLKKGNLTIIKCVGKIRIEKGDIHNYWLAKCDCGNYVYLRKHEVTKNTRLKCFRCSKPTLTHGKSNTKLFNVWQHMRGRCYNKNNKSYIYYGGRGIKICDEWRNNFLNFYNWAINNGYEEKLTIDRINVNGNYEPLNCRWADVTTQANNKTNTRYYELDGEKYTLTELSNKYNKSRNLIQNRLRLGWPLKKALNQEVKHNHRLPL